MTHISRVQSVLRIATLAAFAATTALADGDLHADDTMFNLFNESAGTITEFRMALPDGTTGHNWLEAPLLAGEGLTLEFTDPLDDRCQIKSRAIFDTGMVVERLVNYCGVARVLVTADAITSD
jgi:hypothetical protein